VIAEPWADSYADVAALVETEPASALTTPRSREWTPRQQPLCRPEGDKLPGTHRETEPGTVPREAETSNPHHHASLIERR
jgi:hypothetical protein